VVAYGYDANLNPSLMIDYLNGTPTVKASFVLNPNGTMQAGAIGYDITASPATWRSTRRSTPTTPTAT